MIKLVEKSMPHGAIPIHEIKDQTLRSCVMKINENLRVLESQSRMLVKAVTELQRKEGTV